jgi:hypothetical protein
MSVALRIAPIIFVTAVLQVSAIAGMRMLGAEPDLVLVTVVAVGLVAGSIAGAAAGFAAGLLVDVMTLGVLGTTAIVLTGAGFWAGRICFLQSASKGLTAVWCEECFPEIGRKGSSSGQEESIETVSSAAGGCEEAFVLDVPDH